MSRALPILSALAVMAVGLAACSLGMGGLGEVGSAEGGATLDGGSSGSSSGGDGSGSTDAVNDSATGLDSIAADSSSPETGTPVDSSTPDTGTPETGPPCTVANGCYVIPSSWQLVALAASQSSPCPAGFADTPPANVDEGPNTSSACACGACGVTTAPTCPGGPIQVFFDVGGPQAGQCGSTGEPSSNDNMPNGPGGCDTDMYMGGGLLPYSSMDLKYVPAAATGGTCNSAGTMTGNVTYSSADRTCVPDSQASAGCVGDQCTLTLAVPYAICVFQSGSHSCPGAPFTHQHTVGTSVSLTCSACGCNVSATCTGTMKLFTSNDCSTGKMAQEDDIAADGQCHSSNTSSSAFDSYEYVANPPASVMCSATGTSTAQNVALANEETVCCTQ